MVCAVNKIDSNSTGLRIALEECLGELPTTPEWREQQPNTYSDFGAQTTLTARQPINASRSRLKGVITDLDASGGYNQDFTDGLFTWLMQGFMFAKAYEQPSTNPLNGAHVAITGATGAGFAAASGLDAFKAGALLVGTGFAVDANNAVFVVDASTAVSVDTTPAPQAEATPPASATLEQVGIQFGSGDASLVMVGGLVALQATGMDQHGMKPGDWVYLGDDVAANAFAASKGFARVKSVSATQWVFDKTGWIPAADAGTGKTIRVYTGITIRNEADPDLIERFTYQLERTLGKDVAGPQAEYLVGAVANELTINFPNAEKVNADLTFVACDYETRSGAQGLKTGDRVTLGKEDAFNTSSDFARIKLALVDPTTSNPLPLFAFCSTMTLTVNNNTTPNKALGVLGAFDTSSGNFEVGGNITAYFADTQSAAAVRNNADVTLDICMVKKNKGLLFDVPLLALGDGRNTVTANQPITVALTNSAAQSDFGHTLMYVSFQYLPDIAASKAV